MRWLNKKAQNDMERVFGKMTFTIDIDLDDFISDPDVRRHVLTTDDVGSVSELLTRKTREFINDKIEDLRLMEHVNVTVRDLDVSDYKLPTSRVYYIITRIKESEEENM